MRFDDIIGQEFIKNHLQTSVDNGRIAHAQLFVGPSGSGTLVTAIAYAHYILTTNQSVNTAETMGSDLKFQRLSHPDLHFAFPVATSEKAKSHPISDHYMDDWRTFLAHNPYGDLYDWHRHIGIEKKQGQIGKDEALEINKKLALKSYEGGYKVMIIWMAQKMNGAAANKLLKLIEEPPSKTVFILIAENEDQLIDTIKSRCQLVQFPKFSEVVLATALENNFGLSTNDAYKIAHQADGNYNKALHLVKKDDGDDQFEAWFVRWVRTAFKAKGRKESVIELLKWSEEIAKEGRETQKNFLVYCSQFFRQALLENYSTPRLVYKETNEGFDLSKFAPFVHGNNIAPIIKELEDASFHIERNGNPKIVFSDLSIKLTRLLHVTP